MVKTTSRNFLKKFRSNFDWRGAVGFVLIASAGTIALMKLLNMDLWMAAAASVIGLLLVGVSTFFDDE
jgi:hypothetical protein